MSNSTDKMNVEIVPTQWNNGKDWVKVTLKNSRIFYPSFEDLHRIILAMCKCEDSKYPKSKGYKGRDAVTEILIAMPYTESWEELAKDFNIPIRDGENIVDSNGAKLIPTVKKPVAAA